MFLQYLQKLIWFVIPICSYGQLYVPETSVYVFENEPVLLEEIKRANEILEVKAPREHKTIYEEIYKARLNKITSDFKDSQFINDPETNQFISRIVNHIKERNVELQNLETRFFVPRYTSPNASSLGDGTFYINLGLLRKIDNEGQLAFVLCHELAHLYLAHSEIGIEGYIETYKSKEFETELKKINNSEYQTKSKLYALLKDRFYQDGQHSRNHEVQADTMGMRFFMNTDYSPIEAIRCINLLDTIDYYKFRNKINYKTHFSNPDFSFKERWLTVEQIMFGEVVTEKEYFNRDSIKTHPDCSERVIQLRKSLIDKPVRGTAFLQSKENFLSIKDRMDREYIDAWIKKENYGQAFFHTMKHLESDPDNLFLKHRMGKILFQLYVSQENHELSKYVSKPNSKYEEEYNIALEFIENIRLSELADLAFYFMQKQEHIHDEETYYYKIFFSLKSGKSDAFIQYKNLYLNRYPNGSYLDAVNNLN